MAGCDEARHEVGLRTTATIMFGHVEEPKHVARHLLRINSYEAERMDSLNSCRYLLSIWSRYQEKPERVRHFERLC